MVSEHASPLAVLGGVDAGGQNVHVAELSLALGRLGHDVTIYTRRDDPTLPHRVTMDTRVRVVHLDAGPPEPITKDALLPHMAEMGCNLRKELVGAPVDVVHAHFWMSGVATVAATKELGIPTAVTFHALGSVKREQQGTKDTSPAERIAVEAAVARAVDRVIATSRGELFELVRLGVSRNDVAVVPCGVNTQQFRPQGAIAPRSPCVHRIVVVSRLVERKGIGNVIAALALLPDTELVIGGGPARDRLREDPEAMRLLALAAEVGVSDRVQLLGRVERADVPALLRSADVVVCAPWYEPFGMVAVEAMACGVPVVASAVGGLLDTVDDGVTGVLVPPRDVTRLAAAVRALLSSPALGAKLGRAGAARAAARYAWSSIARETIGAYPTRVNERRLRRVG